jgi:hypothetical protein
MITWIGLCAGEIWQYLDRQESEVLLKDICSGIKAPRETILMALGWLAREGYIILTGTLPNVMVKLNPQPPSKGR